MAPRSLLDLLGVAHPLILAPMAGAADEELAISVARAGGLGSLPCAMLGADAIRGQVGRFRAAGSWPLLLNFFCHRPPREDATTSARWREALDRYYVELGIPSEAHATSANRIPFDDAQCALVEELRPEVVSFHFGLPEAALLERVKRTGAAVLSSATTVTEARWLEANGCDAVIATGSEAGGHRAMFLEDDVSTQIGTFALVPQVVDAIALPVVAAGGIGDGRGIHAAFALGASGVQLGTAFLHTPEARISTAHRMALATGAPTAITNVFTGRPARGVVNRLVRELGPMSPLAPDFPTAGGDLAPIRAAAESKGVAVDYANLWSGQAAALGRRLPAEALTRALIEDAIARMGG